MLVTFQCQCCAVLLIMTSQLPNSSSGEVNIVNGCMRVAIRVYCENWQMNPQSGETGNSLKFLYGYID